MREICRDLLAEYRELAQLVMGLEPAQWQLRTDFYGWSIYDEIAHLCLFDELACVAVGDATGFDEVRAVTLARIAAGAEISSLARERYAAISGPALLTRWLKFSIQLVDQLQRRDPRDRLAWFGPDMSALSFATARLMETWAHGQDIYDVLGIERRAAPRLIHVAHLGVVTHRWSFTVRGLTPPACAPRVELSGPADATWRWNEGSTGGCVRGDALDFCLVVTQRRNVKDTALQIEGEAAEQWMQVAQCFAGPSVDGPPPGARYAAQAPAGRCRQR